MNGVRVSAAFAATFRPVATEPVNMTKSAESMSAEPASPRPVAIRNTSSGHPAARMPSAMSSDVSGVTSLGFSTTVLPAIIAGMQSPKLFVSG